MTSIDFNWRPAPGPVALSRDRYRRRQRCPLFWQALWFLQMRGGGAVTGLRRSPRGETTHYVSCLETRSPEYLVAKPTLISTVPITGVTRMISARDSCRFASLVSQQSNDCVSGRAPNNRIMRTESGARSAGRPSSAATVVTTLSKKAPHRTPSCQS